MAAIIQTCPDCSRVLHFIAEHTNIKVCDNCGSSINRQKDGSLVHKPQFLLTENPGPIRPGTTGSWDNKPFTVLGRFRAWFEESVFNYWTIVFEDGQNAWLGEGYGIYSILIPSTTSLQLSFQSVEKARINQFRELTENGRYLLEKKYKSFKWEVEGELFIPDNNSSSFCLLEFSNTAGKNLAYFIWRNEISATCDVIYVDYKKLNLTNLRVNEYAGKSLICYQCKNQMVVKTFPYAQSCACQSCGEEYALRNGMDFKGNGGGKTKEVLIIPIGSKGILKGIEYEVLGYAQKEEVNIYKSQWREYTLYNPIEGFAFLSEYDGHWIYLRETNDCPVIEVQRTDSIEVDAEPFQLFNSYNYKILNTLGEFPYNIFDNNDVKVQEFISPPEIWIQESQNADGIIWYFGEHISRQTLSKAFDVPYSNFPSRKGVGSVQPVGYVNKFKLLKAVVVACIFLSFLSMALSLGKQNRILISQDFSLRDSNRITIVTEKIYLEKAMSNVRFDISAPVANSWFELGITLVNTETGKEFSTEQGVEYYSGYSDGEYWSEGSNTEIVWLTRIPKGIYYLQLEGSSDTGPGKASFFAVTATYDMKSNRNLWWSIFLLLIGAAMIWIIAGFREKIRWSNSPYSTME